MKFYALICLNQRNKLYPFPCCARMYQYNDSRLKFLRKRHIIQVLICHIYNQWLNASSFGLVNSFCRHTLGTSPPKRGRKVVDSVWNLAGKGLKTVCVVLRQLSRALPLANTFVYIYTVQN